MSTIRQRTALIREKRTGSIAAYAGTAQALAKEAATGGPVQRIRTYTQDVASDLQRVFDLLRTIDGLALVIHGPAGCAAGLHGPGTAVPWTVTGLNQRDSIMGGDGKLRAAIHEIHGAHAPKAIAVIATPVVAINNDDIDAVTVELREELGIPIVPVYSDGFRSKISATGHDVAVHALIKHLLPQRPRTVGSHINLLGIQECAEDVAHLRQLLDETGVLSVPFPRSLHLADLGRVIDARLSVSIDPDESEYAGTALQQTRGVPYLDPAPPIGIAGTSRWLAAIAVASGHEAQAETVAIRHSRRLVEAIDGLGSFAGARIFVNLPPALAFAARGLWQELGLVPVGLKVPSLGSRHRTQVQELAEELPNLPLLIGEGQPFEEVNALRTLKPDLYIGRGGGAIHALRLGIPVLDLARGPVLGYAGVERIARDVAHRLAHPGLARFLADGTDQAYTPGWLAKSTHWFIKHEVK